ncbi:general substrate transporter [Lipomyces kononenkoae]|uniref:General substrate transporter n=1 Tax=Lipomyces kononenkoae TaxID=34357 RepID=A0ACC3T1Y5_LIPKO
MTFESMAEVTFSEEAEKTNTANVTLREEIEKTNAETTKMSIELNQNERIVDGHDAEVNMTLKEGFRKCYKAILWSAFLSLAVIMEGYDNILLSSLFGLPAFKKRYGTQDLNGNWNVSAKWQSAVVQAVKVGQFFGLFIAGWATDKFGFKKTTMLTCVITAALIFMQFFCTSIGMLVAAEILFGLPLSVFLTSTTVYAAEICPLVLRPYLTTWVNLCWTIGKIISAGVLRGFVNNYSQWSYRIPFATQWIWPPIIFFGTIFAPESPWWLVRHDRLDDARRSLQRLHSGATDQEVDNYFTQIMITNKHEVEQQAGTSYFDCFKGSNLRRTEIACMSWVVQPVSGFGIVAFATYFFEQAGLSPSDAFSMSLAQQAIAFCGGIAGWFLLPRIGRRNLMLWGLVASFATQTAIGGLGIPEPKNGVAWSTGAVLFVYVLAYSMTIGPLSFVIVAEMGSSRLRSKTAVLARNAYQIAAIVSDILISYQINSSSWSWRGKAGFFWGGANVLLWVYCYFRLPEIKDRTVLDLDLLFENKIIARKFKVTNIDIIGGMSSHEKAA